MGKELGHEIPASQTQRATRALNRSSEFKDVIVQIVCVVEIQFESAWALTSKIADNTSNAKCHADGSEEEDFKIFLVCISVFQTWDTPGIIHFGP